MWKVLCRGGLCKVTENVMTVLKVVESYFLRSSRQIKLIENVVLPVTGQSYLHGYSLFLKELSL